MATKKAASKAPEMSKAEKIAFHNGALQTLIGERNELYRLVQLTEEFMKAHIQELEKLGVKLDATDGKKK